MIAGVGIMLAKVSFSMIKENTLAGSVSLVTAVIVYFFFGQNLVYTIVISTGESLSAIGRLVEKAGGEIVARSAILAEGDAAKREDIIFLEELYAASGFLICVQSFWIGNFA